MKILLVNVDSKIPNLALMRLSAHHRGRGDDVYLGHCNEKPGRVYASSIFTATEKRRNQVRELWPDVIEGGTGYGSTVTLDEVLGCDAETIRPDYSLWPEFPHSLGFTARGCRLSCKFCVVPGKEGKPKAVHSIADIWRGEGHPKNILLLDNDFFGQPREQWQARVDELRAGGFKVSFNQGINVRMVDEESAAVLASLNYRDGDFKQKRIYTAWDNLRDEERFKTGVGQLIAAGVKPRHLMVYMLIGYDPAETEEAILHRFSEIVALGLMPYPMVFNRERRDLRAFQRWVIRRYYQFIPWDKYRDQRKIQVQQPPLIVIPCP